MVSRKTKHTKTPTSEEQKKAPVCVWLTPKVQLVDHLYTFLVAKDLRIDLKSFKISANGDLSNLPTHQIEWKIHSTKCLRNWNQNMANIETVIGALPKIFRDAFATRKHSHTHTHQGTHTHTLADIHTHSHTQIHTHTHTHTDTRLHTLTHTDTRTHKQSHELRSHNSHAMRQSLGTFRHATIRPNSREEIGSLTSETPQLSVLLSSTSCWQRWNR